MIFVVELTTKDFVMHSLQNDKLKISVQDIGAELCEIKAVQQGTQFMWDANPKIWGSFAPNLFPIIGGLKHGVFKYNTNSYAVPKHGLIRHSKAIALTAQTKDSLVYKLTYSDELLKLYPFKFEFEIQFTLADNKIIVSHTVKNCDSKTMYFSLGGHPAFKCPLFKGEAYSDYSLKFETVEHAVTYILDAKTGLVTDDTLLVLDHTETLPLQHELFDNDALIFKSLKSKRVTLNNNTKGAVVSVDFPDFNYLGIWAKPNGNFVCIEPWLGITDHVNSNQIIEQKEGMLSLEPEETFSATYSITINDTFL